MKNILVFSQLLLLISLSTRCFSQDSAKKINYAVNLTVGHAFNKNPFEKGGSYKFRNAIDFGIGPGYYLGKKLNVGITGNIGWSKMDMGVQYNLQDTLNFSRKGFYYGPKLHFQLNLYYRKNDSPTGKRKILNYLFLHGSIGLYRFREKRFYSDSDISSKKIYYAVPTWSVGILTDFPFVNQYPLGISIVRFDDQKMFCASIYMSF